MNKKWAEDYSSDEGEQDVHEGELVSDEEVVAKQIEQPVETAFIAYITGVNYAASRNDIGNFFESLGCNISKLDLWERNGKSTGNAVMEFQDKQSLDICIGASGSEIMGRAFRTSLTNDAPTYNERRSQHGGDRRNDRHSERGNYRDRQPRDSGRRQDSRYDTRTEPRDNRQQDVRAHRPTEQRSQNRNTPNVSTAKQEKVSNVEPATRPKLEIKPRTLPLEDVGKPVAKSSIFGDGHASDVLAYERKKADTANVPRVPDVSNLTIKESSGSYEVTPPPPPTEPVSRKGPKEGGKPASNRNRNIKTTDATEKVEIRDSNSATNNETAPQRNNRDKSNSQGARIFNSAVSQTVASNKKTPKENSREKDLRKLKTEKDESHNKPPELTDEEKFKRAQLTISKAEGVGAGKAVKKKTGGFDVLGSDDESQDD